MKAIKRVAVLAVVVVFAFALAACSGGANTSGNTSDSSASGSAVQAFSTVSGATVALSAETTEASVEVTVAEGEGLYILANFEEGTDEVTAAVSQGSEENYTDYFYEGYGFSETDVDPGTYSVSINGAGATGTMWVLAYPVNAVDIMSVDSEEAVQQIVSAVS